MSKDINGSMNIGNATQLQNSRRILDDINDVSYVSEEVRGILLVQKSLHDHGKKLETGNRNGIHKLTNMISEIDRVLGLSKIS